LQDFEPYVIVSRELVPAYDERLRGYFENKAVHLRHMAAIGFRFLVHSGGYVVHMPQQSQGVAYRPREPGNQKSRPGVCQLSCSYMCDRISCLWGWSVPVITFLEHIIRLWYYSSTVMTCFWPLFCSTYCMSHCKHMICVGLTSAV